MCVCVFLYCIVYHRRYARNKFMRDALWLLWAVTVVCYLKSVRVSPTVEMSFDDFILGCCCVGFLVLMDLDGFCERWLCDFLLIGERVGFTDLWSQCSMCFNVHTKISVIKLHTIRKNIWTSEKYKKNFILQMYMIQFSRKNRAWKYSKISVEIHLLIVLYLCFINKL